MRMDRVAGSGGPIVAGFGPSGFRVGEERFRAVLLTIEVATGWTPPALDQLSLMDLQPLIDTRPKFILLGTGAQLRRPSAALIAALEPLGIEPMDSRAAARAWGVLRGEGRHIAAALYPLD